ncbi:MAG: metallophosphoesterase [Deltaproteobacteria bacterium]|nr:metallophosphoesterase [Deltaproteobacteria bacterium]
MRIAHFSDLHVLALEGVPRWRLLTNKRVTGYANLLLRRKRSHPIEVVQALARDLATMGIDHVAVTGDVSNLSLETEFEAVCALLEQDLGMSPDAITLVPGNHDRYTRGSARSLRFETQLERYLKSDLELPAELALGSFPVVKLRGPVAMVGLSTAVPRLPFVAAGVVGKAQLDALSWLLAHEEVKKRTLVLMTHHPIAEPMKGMHAWLEGLRDAAELMERLQGCGRGLALHGHLHRRVLRMIPTRAGELWSVGATSASLVHNASVRMAGYNVYEISDSGKVERVSARVLDPKTETFGEAPVPVVALTERGPR